MKEEEKIQSIIVSIRKGHVYRIEKKNEAYQRALPGIYGALALFFIGLMFSFKAKSPKSAILLSRLIAPILMQANAAARYSEVLRLLKKADAQTKAAIEP